MSTLKGARIMLTGGTGFLGSHLKALLEAEEASVHVVSRKSGYDLRNESETLTALLLCRPSIIVHLAASATKDRPASIYRDNLQMGMNVAHAAAIQNASQERVKLVVLGHPASYSTPGEPLAAEDTFWNAAPDVSTTEGALGTAKKTLLLMCQAYKIQYGLPFIYLIPEHLYGPGEYSSSVATAIASVMEAKVQGEYRGSIMPRNALCPLLYVQDAAEAIAQACVTEMEGGPYNLCSKDPGLTKEGLLKTVFKKLSFKKDLIWSDKAAAKTKKVMPQTAFPWKPQTSLEDGIGRYVEWLSPMLAQPVEKVQ